MLPNWHIAEMDFDPAALAFFGAIVVSEAMTGFQWVSVFPFRAERPGIRVPDGLAVAEMIESFELLKT